MANKSNDYIRLDVNSGRLTKKVYVRQGDTVARTICASIVNNGKPIELDDALIVEIIINRADGNVSDNGCVVVGNEIQYTLRSSDISAIGENDAQFVVTYKNGETFTSPNFCIEVYQKNLSDKTIKSANEYTAFAQALALANETAASATAAAATINEYADAAAASAALAAESEANAAESEENAAESESNANAYKLAAAASAASASTSADTATAKETAVNTKAAEIYDYEWQAGTYATNASTSASTATSKATQAEASAANSLTYSTNASTSATNAATSEANAEEWYNKTKAIYDALGTALAPKGTKTFAELDLASAKVGDMFNVSNDFTTTSDFEEGAGIAIAAGTNVYKTTNGKWDCMAAGAKIVVDTTLSTTSENPIANKTVATEIGTRVKNVYLNSMDEWEALTDAQKDDPYTDYIIADDDETPIDAQEVSFSSTKVTGSNVKAAIENAYHPLIDSRDSLEAVTETGFGVDATVVKQINSDLSGLGKKKLWENPSPTSTFSAQTITLSSDDYDYLKVFFKTEHDGTRMMSVDTLKGYAISLCFACTSSQYILSRFREATRLSDTSYKFGDAKQSTVSSAQATQNGACIPVAIYGCKF